jgi:DNA-binding response OmpR family regulator
MGEAVPKILVVDDNEFVVHALSVLLRGEGMQSVCFGEVAPALDYGRRETPAAAVIDIGLPDGSGLDLVRELRRHWGTDLPILIFSADSSLETIRQLPDLGATYFFSKPANASRLLEHLKRWALSSPRQSRIARTSSDA